MVNMVRISMSNGCAIHIGHSGAESEATMDAAMRNEIWNEAHDDGRFEGYRQQRRLVNPYRKGWARNTAAEITLTEMAELWDTAYYTGYLTGVADYERDM